MFFVLSAHPPWYQKGWKLYSFHNAVENRYWGCKITVVIHKCLWNEKSQGRERISQVLSICCSAFYYPQRQAKDNLNYHNFHTQNINKNWLLVLCFTKSSYYFPLSLPVIILRKLIFDSSSNHRRILNGFKTTFMKFLVAWEILKQPLNCWPEGYVCSLYFWITWADYCW